MTQLRATGASKEAEARMRRGQAIERLVVQDKNAPVSIEEQILSLYALDKGVLDPLSASDIGQFKKNFFEYVRATAPDLVTRLRKGGELTDDLKKSIDQCLSGYFK